MVDILDNSFYQSLIDEYLKNPTVNSEFEESMLETLIRDRRIELVLYCLNQADPKFKINAERRKLIKTSGNLQLYQWLASQGVSFDNSDCVYPAETGNIDTLIWLSDKIDLNKYQRELSRRAARNGHQNILLWLNDTIDLDKYDVTMGAIEGGYLEILQWLFQIGKLGVLPSMIAEAADKGHLEIVKWVFSLKLPGTWNPKIISWAAKKNRLEIIQWCRQQTPPCPYDSYACIWAVNDGHLETLQWLIKDGAPYKLSDLKPIATDPKIKNYLNTLPPRQ